jgi:hypothetical protein
MHLEILVEEPSSRKALENLLPKLVINEHTYRIITYQGKHDLLKKLPKTLKGYSKWIKNDYKIIVLVDLDRDNCIELKNQLESYASTANLITKSKSLDKQFQVMNRIAIEELESWFIGDPDAIRQAYPRVGRFENKRKFRQPDSIINTWETLEGILQKARYFSTGLRKVEAADAISTYMIPIKNRSKSFHVFWKGVFDCLI